MIFMNIFTEIRICLILVTIHEIQKELKSKLQKIGTYEVCKISLSCLDDKRYILDDSINSLAYFHKDIFKDKSD